MKNQKAAPQNGYAAAFAVKKSLWLAHRFVAVRVLDAYVAKPRTLVKITELLLMKSVIVMEN
jgi:hypothetical protein